MFLSDFLVFLGVLLHGLYRCVFSINMFVKIHGNLRAVKEIFLILYFVTNCFTGLERRERES